LNSAFGLRGADSLFIDARAGWAPAANWRLGAAWRQGFTRARSGGLIAEGSRLTSNSWSIDLERRAVFARDDSLALRVTQPLRVQSGGLNFDLPTQWDYDSLMATRGISTVPLSPSGRELAGEITWRGSLWGGQAAAGLFYRRNPGHIASAPADVGAALNWKTEF
jgi:hypothetical protein